jgi:hypothetical protein
MKKSVIAKLLLVGLGLVVAFTSCPQPVVKYTPSAQHAPEQQPR